MNQVIKCFCKNSYINRRVNMVPSKFNLSIGSWMSPFKRHYSNTYSNLHKSSTYRKTESRRIHRIDSVRWFSFQYKQRSLFERTHKDFLLPGSIIRNIYTQTQNIKHKTVLLYLTSAAVLAAGLSYAAVPLYRLYCQASGYGGTTKRIDDIGDKIENMERSEDRMLTIRFEAGTNRKLQWRFKPQQKEVKLAPGETALAFYTAENLTDKPIIGIATYNVIPFDAGQYFNKIQCFCFEEQQLNPKEEVDMPVFFYIDPDFAEDPKMAKYDEIILSYTFFESNDNCAPIPSPHSAR